MAAEDSSKSARSYRVERYRPRDQPLVIDLQRHLWGPDLRLNAAYLEWKYTRNPYLPEPLIYLAFEGDALVGMRGAFGTRWQVGDSPESVTLPYADDLVVLPSHRVRLVPQRLMTFAMSDLAQRGYPYVVNISASRETAALSLRMGWRNAGGVRPLHLCTPRRRLVGQMAGQLRRLRLMWRWADEISAACLPSGSRIFRRLDRKLASRSGAVALEKSPRIGAMAELVRRLPHDGRIRHVRDDTYLAWRYSNPRHQYRFFYAGGQQLDGYLVLKRSVLPGQSRVSIVDWEAVDDSAAAALLAAAVEAGLPELDVWAASLAAAGKRLTGAAGFVPVTSEFETSILVRSTRDEPPGGAWVLGSHRLDDAVAWDVRMIYSTRG